MSGMPAAAAKVGSQSIADVISIETDPGLILPGQRIIAGTRKAPSQLVAFSLRNGVVAPSGQELACAPLSVVYSRVVLSAIPSAAISASTVPTFLSWSIITS